MFRNGRQMFWSGFCARTPLDTKATSREDYISVHVFCCPSVGTLDQDTLGPKTLLCGSSSPDLEIPFSNHYGKIESTLILMQYSNITYY